MNTELQSDMYKRTHIRGCASCRGCSYCSLYTDSLGGALLWATGVVDVRSARIRKTHESYIFQTSTLAKLSLIGQIYNGVPTSAEAANRPHIYTKILLQLTAFVRFRSIEYSVLHFPGALLFYILIHSHIEQTTQLSHKLVIHLKRKAALNCLKLGITGQACSIIRIRYVEAELAVLTPLPHAMSFRKENAYCKRRPRGKKSKKSRKTITTVKLQWLSERELLVQMKESIEYTRGVGNANFSTVNVGATTGPWPLPNCETFSAGARTLYRDYTCTLKLSFSGSRVAKQQAEYKVLIDLIKRAESHQPQKVMRFNYGPLCNTLVLYGARSIYFLLALDGALIRRLSAVILDCFAPDLFFERSRCI